MVAITATRLAKFVYSSIAPKQQIVQVHLWTNSQTILHWMQKGNNAKPFISNHVQEICETFPPANWLLYPQLTTQLTYLHLPIKSYLWTHGPHWLLYSVQDSKRTTLKSTFN